MNFTKPVPWACLSTLAPSGASFCFRALRQFCMVHPGHALTEPHPVLVPVPRAGAAIGAALLWSWGAAGPCCVLALPVESSWVQKLPEKETRWGAVVLLHCSQDTVLVRWSCSPSCCDSQAQQVHEHVFWCWYDHERTHLNITQQQSRPNMTKNSNYWDFSGFQMMSFLWSIQPCPDRICLVI